MVCALHFLAWRSPLIELFRRDKILSLYLHLRTATQSCIYSWHAFEN